MIRSFLVLLLFFALVILMAMSPEDWRAVRRIIGRR